MRIHALREIGGNSDDCRHVNIVEQYLCLSGGGISNAKDISIVNNLRHLLPFYSLVQRDKRHGIAPNGSRSQCIYQQESNRRNQGGRYIGRLAQQDAYIFSENDPDCMKKCSKTCWQPGGGKPLPYICDETCKHYFSLPLRLMRQGAAAQDNRSQDQQ